MERVPPCYGLIFAGVTGDMEQQASGENVLRRLEIGATCFKGILASMNLKRCDCDRYTPKYHLGDQMVDDMPRLRRLSVLDHIPYEHFHLHNRHAFKKASERRQTGMMEALNLMERRSVEGTVIREEEG